MALVAFVVLVFFIQPQIYSPWLKSLIIKWWGEGGGTNDLETEKDSIISLKLTECSSICLLRAFGNVLHGWSAEQRSHTIMMMSFI